MFIFSVSYRPACNIFQSLVQEIISIQACLVNQLILITANLRFVVGKQGLMHMHKESTQINLRSLHRLISDNTFFVFMKSFLLMNSQVNQKVSFLMSLCRLRGLIWDDTLRPCIKRSFARARLTFLSRSLGTITFMFQHSLYLDK